MGLTLEDRKRLSGAGAPRRRRNDAPPPNALAYTIDDACRISRLGRSTIYREVKAGKLVLIKVGRRSLITGASLRRRVGAE